MDFQFTFVPSLSIMLSDNILHIDDLTPGNYASSNTIRINVTTNSAFGYTLTATVGDGENYTSNELINADADATFSGLESSDKLALNNFDPNYWGYTTATSISNSSLYSGLLYDASTIINKTMNPSGRAFREYPGTNTTSFTIGASAGNDQFSGEYTNVIGFELIANVDTDIYTYMQDVTKAQLATLLPNTGDTTILIDKRDYNEYQVTNIDGTYWMTQNLRIMGTVTAELSNFTGADFNISSDLLDSGDSRTESRASYNENVAYGAYYNYCAASAGTVCGEVQSDAQSDVCPFRWRLPNQSEIQIVSNNLGENWSPIAAGYYDGGALIYTDERGYWWSSTAYSTASQYRLYYRSGDNYWAIQYNNKSRGYSIRCIKADD